MDQVRTELCNATQAVIATKFNITADSITITSCTITSLRRRALLEGVLSRSSGRALQTGGTYRACVRDPVINH